MIEQYCFKVDKLVRDKYSEIMSSKGVTVSDRIVQKEEYIQCLEDKLSEEVQEAVNAIHEDHRKEELADVLEAFLCLCSAYGFSYEDVEEVRMKKQEEKGSYRSGIYVDSIQMTSDNEASIYYLAESERYPQLNNCE